METSLALIVFIIVFSSLCKSYESGENATSVISKTDNIKRWLGGGTGMFPTGSSEQVADKRTANKEANKEHRGKPKRAEHRRKKKGKHAKKSDANKGGKPKTSFNIQEKSGELPHSSLNLLIDTNLTNCFDAFNYSESDITTCYCQNYHYRKNRCKQYYNNGEGTSYRPKNPKGEEACVTCCCLLSFESEENQKTIPPSKPTPSISSPSPGGSVVEDDLNDNSNDNGIGDVVSNTTEDDDGDGDDGDDDGDDDDDSDDDDSDDDDVIFDDRMYDDDSDQSDKEVLQAKSLSQDLTTPSPSSKPSSSHHDTSHLQQPFSTPALPFQLTFSFKEKPKINDSEILRDVERILLSEEFLALLQSSIYESLKTVSGVSVNASTLACTGTSLTETSVSRQESAKAATRWKEVVPIVLSCISLFCVFVGIGIFVMRSKQRHNENQFLIREANAKLSSGSRGGTMFL